MHSVNPTLRTFAAIWGIVMLGFALPAKGQPFEQEQLPPVRTVEDLLEETVVRFQSAVADDARLDGIRLVGAEFVPRPLAAGQDLRVRVEGGTVAQRVLLHERLRAAVASETPWTQWLVTNGIAVVYRDEPADLDRLTSQPIAPEIAPHIAELLQLLQDQVELDPRLNGVLLLDGQFYGRDSDPGRELRIIGRAVSAEQLLLLENVVFDSLAALPYWQEARGLVFVALRDLRIAPPSEVLARRYYGIGVNAFWRCELDVANRAFMRAIAESPGSLTLRYWRVVALLAACEDDRAEGRIAMLVQQLPYGSDDPIIAAEFERLQGPLRQKLRAMERNLLLVLP